MGFPTENEQEDNNNNNNGAVESTVEVTTPTVRVRTTRKRGIMRTASSTISSGLAAVETTAKSVEISLDIAATSLRLALAETIAEGVQDLMKLGYSQEDAEKILMPN